MTHLLRPAACFASLCAILCGVILAVTAFADDVEGPAPAQPLKGDPFAPPLKPGVKPPATPEVKPAQPAVPSVVKVALSKEQPPAKPAPNDFDAQVEAALDRHVDVELQEATLEEIASALAKTLDTNVRLDLKSLNDVGVGGNTPITRKASGVPAREALRLILKDLDLLVLVQDEECLITTPEHANYRLELEVHDVRELVAAAKDEEGEGKWLVELVTALVAPATWDSNGGPGSVRCAQATLVVSQTREVQAGVRQLLTQLATVKKRVTAWDGKAPLTAAPGHVPSPAELAIEKAFATRVDLDFIQKPLDQVVAAIAKQHSIAARVDFRSLANLGIAPDSPVSYRCRKQTLRVALRNILRDHDLTYSIEDDELVIRAPDAADESMPVVFYPVPDLVAEGPFVREEMEMLGELVQSSAATTSWIEVGGSGVLIVLPHCRTLAIKSHNEPHHEVAVLLEKLRKARGGAPHTPALVTKILRVPQNATASGQQLTSNQLADMIQELVDPQAKWNAEGSKFRIKAYPGRIVVTHTAAGLRRIDKLLGELYPSGFNVSGGLGNGGGFNGGIPPGGGGGGLF